MVDNCNYVGKFECAVCQGVEAHSDYCVLNCGHPFHVLCVETWLERSATCPSCRAKVTRRQIRPLTGVQSVADAEGDEGFQQQLTEKQQRLEELQQHLDQKGQQVDQLTATVCELSSRQDRLQTKLADARRRCATLEAAQLEDQQRVCNLTADKHKLLEKYRTDVALLQHQLKEEQHLRQRQAAELRRLQLSNPRLNMSAIHAIASDITEQQSSAALASVLADRNNQLQEVKAQVDQLHDQLTSQQEAAARQLETARMRHEAEMFRAEQEKQQHMKDALQLEYENSKLKHENEAVSQQLHQLQGVLLALQGGNTLPAQQPRQQQQQPLQENMSRREGQQQMPAHLLQQHLQQSKQRQQQPCSSKQIAVLSIEGTTTEGASKGTSRDVVDLAADEAWVPATQRANSPWGSSSSSQQLDELPDELTGKEPQQQTSHQVLPDTSSRQKHPQATQQQQQYRCLPHMVKAAKQHAEVQQVDVLAAVGPGSLLRPGPALQAPSFFAKGKATHGGSVTGDFVRSGPDGRGGIATYLKQGPKRWAAFGGIAASSKKPCVGAAGFVTATGSGRTHGKTAQTGIVAFLAKE